MTSLGFGILGFLLLIEFIEFLFLRMNMLHTRLMRKMPSEAVLRVYDRELFEKSATYQLRKTHLAVYEKIAQLPLFYGFFIFGGFTLYTNWLNATFASEWTRGMLLFSAWALMFFLAKLPFAVNHTFVIEKEYGFNRTTPMLYIRDTIISGFLGLVLMAVLLGAVLFMITVAKELWWFYTALFISGLQLFMIYIYPTFIAPLFNSFTELEDGELKERIETLAKAAQFPVTSIVVMDASRRTSHSNAYFTGLGKKRRIVLFDTLLKNHTTSEIVSILAHEIAHYKLGHIRKMLAISATGLFIGAYLLGQLLNNPFLYEAFGVEQHIYSGLFLMSILISPIAFVLTPVFATLSRSNEYNADRFGVDISGDRESFIAALVKLHQDNLSNPAPHPFYSRFYYTHPTLPERVAELKNRKI